MPKPVSPRHGSMQFWPRKRAKRIYPRLRSYSKTKEKSITGFMGYKAGMTYVMMTDNYKHSITKGEEIRVPVTVVECPPMRIAAVRFYKENNKYMELKKQINFKVNKQLKRKTNIPASKEQLDKINPDDFDEITILIYTQPHLIKFKKKPELFEIFISGSKEEKLALVKEKSDKEIHINDVFKAGNFVDVHAVTKGKGMQGPVKRFGINLKPHKSEKGRRRPGSLGPWVQQGHVMYRAAFAGQTGYHQRTDYNKQILKINNSPEDINPKGGFRSYGTVKGEYLLIKGSIPGPKKRGVILTKPIRESKYEKESEEAPDIHYISKGSQQGLR
ncbi:50S ribosomal protein L3 [Candidatus Woesearchaeota archaeon]|nr:50S ribosomal protein L3 [Candidatus Woesearchaeota archaeon]